MDTKNKKHYLFMGVSSLIILLLIIMIIMVNMVHTPYSKHEQNNQSLRNALLSSNHMQYDKYFYPYYGEKTYYIMKVKQEGKKKLVAFDEKKKLVATFDGGYVDMSTIKKKIETKDHHEVKDVHICFEDDKFMYYVKYQNKNHLYYYFYSMDGEFVKSYNL